MPASVHTLLLFRYKNVSAKRMARSKLLEAEPLQQQVCWLQAGNNPIHTLWSSHAVSPQGLWSIRASICGTTLLFVHSTLKVLNWIPVSRGYTLQMYYSKQEKSMCVLQPVLKHRRTVWGVASSIGSKQYERPDTYATVR